MIMSATKLEEAFSERVEEIAREKLSLCYQCGTCTAVCPLGVPVRKLLRAAQLGIKELAVSGGELWDCATCRLCELACPRGVRITDAMHALRVIGFEERKAPSKLEAALWGVYDDANPWGGKKMDRAKWAEGLGVKDMQRPSKYLLYVGCAVSFDPRLQRVARSLVEILKDAGIDFGILGEKENCCGDVVYQVGEVGFLEELVQNNIEMFKKSGAESIITVSPHCFNMFRAVYPSYGETPPAMHYTELLADLLSRGILKTGEMQGNHGLNITYHDPCYLGRYHGIYEAPRRILESVPGAALTEMKDSKANALCCGGGGGLMWTEFSGDRPSHQRVSQAAASGASVMATSCPYCIQNFEDGVKTKGIGNLKVMDVSEILAKALKPSGVE